jgi:hypothetical protein
MRFALHTEIPQQLAAGSFNLEIKKSGIEQYFFHEFLSSKFKNLRLSAQICGQPLRHQVSKSVVSCQLQRTTVNGHRALCVLCGEKLVIADG